MSERRCVKCGHGEMYRSLVGCTARVGLDDITGSELLCMCKPCQYPDQPQAAELSGNSRVISGQSPGNSGLSDERLDELARLAEAATPGPWVCDPYGAGYVEEADTGRTLASWTYATPHEEKRNSRFSAAADPPTVLALVAELKRRRADDRGRS